MSTGPVVITEDRLIGSWLAAACAQQGAQQSAVCGHNGQTRSFRPLPYRRTCAGVSNRRSATLRPTISPTRAPVLNRVASSA